MNLINFLKNRQPENNLLRIITAVILALVVVSGLMYQFCGFNASSYLPSTPLCVFRFLTGAPCPGCGMTRAFLAVSRLDFALAWSYNPISFPLLTVMALYVLNLLPARLAGASVACYALLGVCVFWLLRLL